jgi:hypothetical protein
VRRTTLGAVGNVGIVVLVAVLVAVAVGVTSVVLARGKRGAASDPVPDASRSTIAPPAPMVGLESALDQAMDRSGRPMREKLEAEAAIVDDLKVPDDTGPILRRALDRVEHTEPAPPVDGATQ